MSERVQKKTQKFVCPYCKVTKTIASSPNNLMLHIVNNHTAENIADFKENYYLVMQRLHNKTLRIVFFIAIYLSLAFLISGLLTFSAWTESDLFAIVGWDWNQTRPSIAENNSSEPSEVQAQFPQNDPNTFKVVIYSLSAGAFGAIAYALWGLVEHYCRFKDFDSIWGVWYLVAPISGAITGLSTYAVIVGGLFILGDETPISSNWSLFALTFLAGFSTKKVIRKLRTIAGDIFENPNSNSNPSSSKT